jgi:hypothetical protein
MVVTNLLDREKNKVIDRLLEDRFTLLHINPKHEGVVLPASLLEELSVTLKISRLFRGMVALESKEIVTDLIFSDEYFRCIIPYGAIWAVTSESGQITSWQDKVDDSSLKVLVMKDVPSDSETPSEPTVEQETFEDSASEAEKVKLVLMEVKPEADDEPQDKLGGDSPKKKTLKHRPRLVRIK